MVSLRHWFQSIVSSKLDLTSTARWCMNFDRSDQIGLASYWVVRHNLCGLNLYNCLLFGLLDLARFSCDSYRSFLCVIGSASEPIVCGVIVAAKNVVRLIATGLVVHFDGSNAL